MNYLVVCFIFNPSKSMFKPIKHDSTVVIRAPEKQKIPIDIFLVSTQKHVWLDLFGIPSMRQLLQNTHLYVLFGDNKKSLYFHLKK